MDDRPGGCRKVAHDFVWTVLILGALVALFASPLLKGCAGAMNALHSITAPDEGQPGSQWL